MTTTGRTLYAAEGRAIQEKDSLPHSATARKVYLPKTWLRVVVIDVTPDRGRAERFRRAR